MYMSVCGHPFFNWILFSFSQCKYQQRVYHAFPYSYCFLLQAAGPAQECRWCYCLLCREEPVSQHLRRCFMYSQWLAYAHILIFSMQHNLETVCEDCKYSCLYLSWWYYSQHHLQRSQGQNFKQFREGEPVKHVSTCWRITYIIFISFNMQYAELIVICWFNLGASNVD